MSEEVQPHEKENLELTSFKLPKPTKVVGTPVIPAQHPPRKPETLEDLYFYYPEIGNGEYRLRVERSQPKSYGGATVSGWIIDLDEQISIEEFRARFGGNKYQISVMGPMKDAARLDANGRVPTRVLANIDVTVPGPPVMGPGDQDMMRSPMPMYGGEAPNVTAKRLELEARAQERRDEEMRRLWEARQANQAPEHVVNAMGAQYRETAENLRSMAEQQILVLREQQKVMLDEIQKKEEELKALRAELIAAKSESIESARNAETALERRLFGQHQNEIAALKESFNRELGQMKDTSKRETEQLEKLHRERMDEIQRRYADDLMRKTTESVEERGRIMREAERSEKSIRDTYEARINDLVRTTERELASVRDQRDREINAMRATFESSEKFVKQTSEVRLGTLGDEIGRVRSECETLKRENDQLRKQVHKDPMQFIKETKEFAETVLDWGPQQPEKEEEEPGDWKKMAAKGVMKFIEKLPDTAKQVTEQIQTVRQQNQQQVMLMQQHQAQAHAQQQNQQRALAMRRRAMPPPWTTMPGVQQQAAAQSGVLAGDVPFSPPIPSRSPAYPSAPTSAVPMANEQAPQSAVQIQPPPVQVSQPSVHVEPSPVQESSPSVPPPADTPLQAAPSTQATEEGFEQFISQLDQIIRDDVIPPSMFAQGFLEQVGPQQAYVLLQQISADMFIELIEKQGKGAAITTRDGKQYVRAVWQEVANGIARSQQTG